MHIVESGKRYRIFNNAITTYDQLPPKTYRVDYDPDTRTFSLLEAHDFEIPETKIYGQHLDKVKKVLNAMDKMNRNLGVILSGDKGIGKSLFSKCLGLKSSMGITGIITARILYLMYMTMSEMFILAVLFWNVNTENFIHFGVRIPHDQVEDS